MNSIINQHFDRIEARLLQSPVIVAYEVLSREVSHKDGKLRIKATLRNSGMLELFEYDIEVKGYIRLMKYSFHWQDTQATLQKRWDNAPHYPHLPNAPHHVHNSDGTVEANVSIPDALYVIGEIERRTQQ